MADFFARIEQLEKQVGKGTLKGEFMGKWPPWQQPKRAKPHFDPEIDTEKSYFIQYNYR